MTTLLYAFVVLTLLCMPAAPKTSIAVNVFSWLDPELVLVRPTILSRIAGCRAWPPTAHGSGRSRRRVSGHSERLSGLLNIALLKVLGKGVEIGMSRLPSTMENT